MRSSLLGDDADIKQALQYIEQALSPSTLEASRNSAALVPADKQTQPDPPLDMVTLRLLRDLLSRVVTKIGTAPDDHSIAERRRAESEDLLQWLNRLSLTVQEAVSSNTQFDTKSIEGISNDEANAVRALIHWNKDKTLSRGSSAGPSSNQGKLNKAKSERALSQEIEDLSSVSSPISNRVWDTEILSDTTTLYNASVPRSNTLVSGLSHDNEVNNGMSWARKVDDPWLPLVLTFDGGGVRAYSSLLILKRLMEMVAAMENRFEELTKPKAARHHFVPEALYACHYFDFVYGSGTGGLIAIMLGRLRMGVHDSLNMYKELCGEMFKRRRSVIPLATKYHRRPLEAAIKRMVKQYCPLHKDCDGTDWYSWHEDEDEDKNEIEEEPWNPDTEKRICES
jgi:hypothetical protein